MNGRHWALVSLLAAASCTVGPDYVRPEFFDDGQLSAALEAGSGESFPISVRWYRQFEDETLNGLVARRQSERADCGAEAEAGALYADD